MDTARRGDGERKPERERELARWFTPGCKGAKRRKRGCDDRRDVRAPSARDQSCNYRPSECWQVIFAESSARRRACDRLARGWYDARQRRYAPEDGRTNFSDYRYGKSEEQTSELQSPYVIS